MGEKRESAGTEPGLLPHSADGATPGGGGRWFPGANMGTADCLRLWRTEGLRNTPLTEGEYSLSSNARPATLAAFIPPI